jgi:hypothetical protein
MSAIATFKLYAFVAAAALGFSGCTSQEPPRSDGVTVASPQEPRRSYLDPGPAPTRSGGPNYVRDNRSNGPRQTDAFGNDVLPQVP